MSLDFQAHYVGWRAARLAALSKYLGPEFFAGKEVLEVGCGHGDLGAMLRALGAEVTCSDARAEHVQVLRERYPGLNSRVDDLDSATWVQDVLDARQARGFDVVVHFGVLYHLEDVERSLHDVARLLKPGPGAYLLLETEVCDSEDADVCLRTCEHGYDQAFNSIGSRPSPPFVERALERAGFQHVIVKDPILNHDIHRYDWPHEHTGAWSHGLRRFWVCARHAAAAPSDP